MARQAESNSKTKRVVFIPLTIEEEIISDNFKKLCRQDGLKVHDLMLEAIQLLFKKHNFPPGNPQLTLQNFSQGKQVLLGKCGYANCSCKAVVEGAVYLPNNKEYKLCMKHFGLVQNDLKNWRFAPWQTIREG